MSINPNLPVFGPMTLAESMIPEDQSTANLQASAGELKVNGPQTKAVAVASGNYKIPMGEQFTAAMSKAGKIALAVIKAVGYILATVLTGGLALISKNFRNHASDAIFGTNKVAYSKYVEAEKGLNHVDQPVERDQRQDYVGQKGLDEAIEAFVLKEKQKEAAEIMLATIGEKQAEAKAEAEKAKAEAEKARRREEEPTIMEQVEDHPVVAAGVTATVLLLGLAAFAQIRR